MTWSKFDDRYDEHDKVEEAWFRHPPNPVGLHVMATTACNRWLSDGVIKPRWLASMLPKPKDYETVLATMVDVELFDLLPEGEQATLTDSDGEPVVVGPFAEDRYLVHDFLERHDSKRQVTARRAADAARKRKGFRKESAGTTNGSPA